MKPSTTWAYALLTLGFALQTYVTFFEASKLHLGFWLWGLSPYFVGGVLLFLLRQPQATVGALAIPVVMDTVNFYSVFLSPQGSTAALGYIFVPLWNLVVFVPLGGLIGWWIGKRRATKEHCR